MSKVSSSFAGNVLKLVTGSVFAQGLGILVAPIITRLFAPEAFGIAALITSITGIIGVVACLRYESSIMLPKTDQKAASLLGVSLCFVLIITGISALIIFFAGDFIVQLFNARELKRYLWLIPIAVFFNGIFLALNYWSSRTKHFSRLSIARVVSSITTHCSKLGAGFAGFVSGGVLIGTSILGQIVCTSILSRQVWKENVHLFEENFRWKKMIAGLKRHKRFPIYSAWTSLLNNASAQLPVLILAFYFSPEVVGFYALGRRVLSMPMTLVGGAVAQPFFQKASEVHSHNGNLSQLVEAIFKRLVSLGIFPILMLTLIGEEFFVVVFGTRWTEAGIYMQILGLWIFFQFISSPITKLFSVLERQSEGLLFNFILFITRVSSLIIGGMYGNVRFTLFLFMITGVAWYSFQICWLISKAGLPVVRALHHTLKYTLYISPMLIIIGLGKWLTGLQETGILLLCSCCAVIYYTLVISQDEQLRKP